MRRVLIDGRPLQGGSSVRGIGTYVRGLLGGLAEIGRTRDVALLLERGAIPAEVAGLGVGIGPRVPHTHRRIQPLLDPALVAAALRRHRPQLYHATEWGQPARAAIPVVVTVHDLIPFVLPGYPWKSRERLRLARRMLRDADHLIVPSQATADDCVQAAGCDASRIRVIPHGIRGDYHPVDADAVAAVRRRFSLPRPFIFTAGTMEPHKRPELLAEVTAALRRSADVDVVIAGTQSIFEAPLRAQLDRFGLGGHAHVLGHVTTAELIALYSAAAAVVHTSAYEGFGLPVLEAMACGAPVAVFATASLPEVAGDAGIVVPDGDAEAMARALAELIGDPREHARRRELGLWRAAEFTWARSARAHAAVYDELLA